MTSLQNVAESLKLNIYQIVYSQLQTSDPIQPDDNPAGITRQEQQDFIMQATVDFLYNFNLCPGDPDNDYDNDTVCGDVDNCPSLANSDQLDSFPPEGNDIGDACDCEGDFNCDGNVDATDVTAFLNHFGRNQFNDPCTGGESL